MNNFAYLVQDSPFFSIFPNGAVPIKNIFFPCQVRLEGSAEREAYMLDWSKCTAEQREEIAKCVVDLRGGEASEFIKFMDSGGDMPIRLSQTSGCSTDVPFFL